MHNACQTRRRHRKTTHGLSGRARSRCEIAGCAICICILFGPQRIKGNVKAERHNLSDAEIVRLTLEGGRSSFDVLVDRYRDLVYRLAYFKVRRPDEAEDLAQDAFVAAYHSLARLRDPGRFAPWLRRVAENVCNMHLRRAQLPTVPLEDYHSQSDARGIERWLLDSRIHDALSKLSETNRLAATLFFVDGFSQKEIAQFLDVPVTTVKRRINLSRTQLRKELLDIMKDTIGPERPDPDFTDRVAARIDVLRWCRQFGDYINAGVSLVRALARMEEGECGDVLKAETHAVRTAIEQGAHLTTAIKEHAPSLNEPLIVGMLRAGEIGGVLHHSLNTIVAWMEREDIGLKVDAAYWLRTLAMMLSAGVPVIQAIDTMQHVRAADPLPDLQARLKESIPKGGRFPRIFAEFPSLFSPAVIALIAAGEENGMLDTALVAAASEILREAFDKVRTDTVLSIELWQREKLAEQVKSQLADKSPESRIGALQALEQLTGSESIEYSVRALDDRSAGVRRTASEILGRHPSPESVNALIMAAKDKTADVRQAALVSLSSIDPEAGFEQAKSMLADESVEVRRTAIRIMGSSGHEAAIQLLVPQLGDEEMLVVREAMDALIHIGVPAVPLLVSALGEPEPKAPAAALETLAEIDPAKGREGALDLVQRGIVDARSAAMRTIAGVATVEDIPLLIEALSDSDPYGVVREAVRALGRLKAKDAVPGLVRVLDHPEDWVALYAAHALGEIGDASAVPALMAKLSPESPPRVTLAAIEALGHLKAKDAVPALIGMLDNSSNWIVIGSAQALAAIGDKSAIAALEAKLSLENWDRVTDAVIEALRHLRASG